MIEDSIKKLDQWVQNNGWAGYDPYDVRGVKLLITLQKSRFTDYGITMFLNRFPMFFRNIFKVNKEINPKAMALFAGGYLNMYHTSGDKNHLSLSQECLNWLMENSSEGYSGHCWGYPFDWQARMFIPKFTPSGVVTSIAAQTFLDAYELLRDDRYLKVALSCCDFIAKDLNIDDAGDKGICFSYTPLDQFHVHNANLFSASTLMRGYAYNKNEEYLTLGKRAMEYTVGHQRDDGSWYYWAPPDKLMHKIDNYHTGFMLDCLKVAKDALGSDFAFDSELNKGLEFYKKNLFLNDGTPKITNESTYPINIHSCAQGIITFSKFSEHDAGHIELARKIACWTIQNMQDDDGHFYYKIYKNGHVDKMPYIRWGQAWMLRALSYVVGD